MKLLIDINIILDIFLKREPFFISAAHLFQLLEENKFEGFLSALSFPIIFYLLSKELSKEKAVKILEKIRIVLKIAPVNEKIIDLSLAADFVDFEDAIQYYSAIEIGVDYIITRDKVGFKESKLSSLAPDEFLAIFENK